MINRLITDSNDINLICNMYDKQHMSCTQIAKIYSCSYGTILEILRNNNIEIERYQSKRLKILKDDIVNDYLNNHLNCVDLGLKYNFHYSTINYFLKREGVQLREIAEESRKYNVNENYFEKIDTEEKAYWLGFIYADGCVYNNFLIISLWNNDKTHLIKCSNSMKSEYKLKYKSFKNKSGYISHVCEFRIYSEKIYNDLIKLGVFPRKSLILKFPTPKQVPPVLLKHFIRGYFDGDGGITISNFHLKPTISISFTGTYNMMLNIIFNIPTNNKNIKIHKQDNIYHLPISGNIQTLRILSYLYDDANIYLDRKYNKYKNAKACYEYYYK